MTTATDLPTTTPTGAPIVSIPGQAHRQHEAIALRNMGLTWAEVARAGYSSAGTAEYAVMRYVAWRNGNPGRRTLARNAMPTWSLTRSFGVEIEFRGITAAAAARALEPVLGELLTVRRYHAAQSAGTYDQWSLELDGSVTYVQRGTGLNIGGELVSPVLSGPEGFAQLTAVMYALTAAGAKVDRATGMHVHVDARDLTGEQIARLIGAYVDRQSDFDQFVSPSRRNNGRYCRAMTETEKARIKDQFKADRTAPTLHNGTLRNAPELTERYELEREAEVDSDVLAAIVQSKPGKTALPRLRQVRGGAAIAWLDARDKGPTVHASRVFGSTLVIAQTADGDTIGCSTEALLRKAATAQGVTLDWIHHLGAGSYIAATEGVITNWDRYKVDLNQHWTPPNYARQSIGRR